MPPDKLQGFRVGCVHPFTGDISPYVLVFYSYSHVGGGVAKSLMAWGRMASDPRKQCGTSGVYLYHPTFYGANAWAPRLS